MPRSVNGAKVQLKYNIVLKQEAEMSFGLIVEFALQKYGEKSLKKL